MLHKCEEIFSDIFGLKGLFCFVMPQGDFS